MRIEKKVSKPDWLKIKLPTTSHYRWMNQTIRDNQLHTICTSGKCPNAAECWGAGTATFMILGDICTRSCKFCNVKSGKPMPIDAKEPLRIARSIKLMNLKHAVITSVDRDDLADGGASVWSEVIRQVRALNPDTTLEVLIPDFDGHEEALAKVIAESPEVISHNLETVRRLTPLVRSRAKYDVSLTVLSYLSRHDVVVKSGIMLGLGEMEHEVLETMQDIRRAGALVMTIGQYLQPSSLHWPVVEYIHPDKFEFYRQKGLEMGFQFVESSPLVRSSYHAHKHVNAKKNEKQ